jgi:PAS domain S-box-containing protein
MEDRKQVLKGLLRRLHEGADPEQIKEECRQKLGDIPPAEMAKVEDELVKDGLHREELQKFCDIHLALLKESFDTERPLAPAGHPINILMEEHKMLLQFADELKKVAGEMKAAKDFVSAGDKTDWLKHIVKHLKESESHYVREENVLFPSLEKHGIKEPPAVMWMEHDRIREVKKSVYRIVDSYKIEAFADFVTQLDEVALALAEILSGHFYKENNILFPAALEVIGENEWLEIRRQFDELGYCCFTPEPAMAAFGETRTPVETQEVKGMISFPTGNLSSEQIEAIFNNLPVDVTFVDKDDTVCYFSQSKDRIFPRAKAIIGLKVQQCHPQKSVQVVNQILEDFKTGKKDSAQFWINLQGKLVYIRYFAVRKDGAYMGCLEVTQDITDIKKIRGERRLLQY